MIELTLNLGLPTETLWCDTCQSSTRLWFPLMVMTMNGVDHVGYTTSCEACEAPEDTLQHARVMMPDQSGRLHEMRLDVDTMAWVEA